MSVCFCAMHGTKEVGLLDKWFTSFVNIEAWFDYINKPIRNNLRPVNKGTTKIRENALRWEKLRDWELERLVQVLALPVSSWEALEKILDLSTASSVKLRQWHLPHSVVRVIKWYNKCNYLGRLFINVNYHPPKLYRTRFVGNQQQRKKIKAF